MEGGYKVRVSFIFEGVLRVVLVGDDDNKQAPLTLADGVDHAQFEIGKFLTVKNNGIV